MSNEKKKVEIIFEGVNNQTSLEINVENATRFEVILYILTAIKKLKISINDLNNVSKAMDLVEKHFGSLSNIGGKSNG